MLHLRKKSEHLIIIYTRRFSSELNVFIKSVYFGEKNRYIDSFKFGLLRLHKVKNSGKILYVIFTYRFNKIINLLVYHWFSCTWM